MPVRMLSRLLSLCVGFAILFGQAPRPSDAEGTAPKSKGKANRLARETSPYLLMHAQNPVDWYPWGPEAFEKARKEGKLIFLSIGYSSCYWCHVMERKVFMNEQIAKTMNDNFVCIKVDREERPDIDDVYMTALTVYFQLIGSPAGGGWPLSMFLTPDGKPVAGGTYFPPEDINGAHGFPTVMARMTDLWKSKREKAEEYSQIISDETRRAMRPKLGLQGTEVNEALIGKAFEAIVSSIDPLFGGVDFNPQRPNGPKFPTPAKLLFLQDYLKNHPDPEASDLLNVTLLHVACGGIRDHVGGGFHRYSVDRKWNVPHFEKMLYDQAQLVEVFVNAYVDSKNKFFKQAAEETLQFVEREMTSPEGGFYSSLDAETNGVEGEFYVWDSRDIDRVLGDKAHHFKEAYHVKELPDFEYGNVLRLSSDQLPTQARSGQIVGVNTDFEADEFTTMRQKLLLVRNQRPKVKRDEKILSGWNGLMIGAFARAGMRFGQPQFLQSAEKAGTFLMTNLRDPQGRLLHTYTSGQAKLNAYLDDYAYVIDGFLALHEATRDPKWLKGARQFQDDQLKMFRDEAGGGGFYFTSHQHEELLARTKNCYDGVQPSGNSVSARNLLKLARLTSDKRYRDEARSVIDMFASNLDQNPRMSSVLALAMSELLASEQSDRQSSGPSTNVIVAVAADDSKTKAEPLVVFADQKEADTKKDDPLKVKAYLSVDRLPPGSSCQLIVLLDLKKGWHVNANPPNPDYLKPVKVTWKSKSGVTLADLKYPPGKAYKFKESEEQLMVYEGETQIRATLKIPKEAAGRLEEGEISVEYQACNDDEECLAPRTIKLTGKLPIAKEGDTIRAINAKLFGAKVDQSR